MSTMNRLANVNNRFQGDTKRVLCVCSAGLLRSPTAAVVLSQDPFNFNTRAAGITEEFALIPVDKVLLSWADEVVCMEAWQEEVLRELILEFMVDKVPVINLDVPDNYPYRDTRLMELITERYNERKQS